MTEPHRRSDRLRSFVIGGVVGASAALATRRRRRPRRKLDTPTGLAAFETAPCYRELVERESAKPPRDF